MKKRDGDADVARRLLARLRDVMAGGGSAQDRLDKVVRSIAESLKADVCSCYVMRAGEVLELFSTQGLRESAVHQTRLRVGEGLVGEVAAHGRSVALADAWSHPSFAYRPETGEELYHSFMGVPIIRGSRVIGVVVVQNREERGYSDVEVETLETVSMVLAELLSADRVVAREELLPADGIALLPLRMEGLGLAPGVGVGMAVLHEPQVRVGRLVAEDPEAELARLRVALTSLRREVDDMLAVDDVAGDFQDVLQAYRMFADDTGWVNKISEAVRSGLTAEAAVQKVHDDTRVRMSQVTDPYLRERLHDLEDLANRLLHHLVGEEGRSHIRDLPEDTILVCRNLGPTELLDYDRSKVRGLIIEEGSRTMHAVIVARALGIPVVGRIKDVFSVVENWDPLIMDGDHGQVFVRPSEDVRETFETSLRTRQAKLEGYAALRDLPGHTRDGQTVRLMLNAGLLIDMPHLAQTGADGIGLYRTELPFMARPSLPDVAAQSLLYSRILDQADGKPVAFRTLDVGSDKVLPYWHGQPEDNPAMGWRSIRITLDRPAILRHQLRALISAAADRELRVMFPMIAELAELRQAREVLDMELERVDRLGAMPPPSRVYVGTMLEVPALLWQLPGLLSMVDFISVGTNDLVQFLFATDRGNPRMADRYDPLSPAVLRVLREIVAAADERGIACSICGEMAGRPLEAMALIALGYRTLSMSPGGVGPVKSMVRSLDVAETRRYVEPLLGRPDHSLRHKLRAYAQDHGIVVG